MNTPLYVRGLYSENGTGNRRNVIVPAHLFLQPPVAGFTVLRIHASIPAVGATQNAETPETHEKKKVQQHCNYHPSTENEISLNPRPFCAAQKRYSMIEGNATRAGTTPARSAVGAEH